MGYWQTRAVCRNCGAHFYAPYGSLVLAVGERGCCPECGAAVVRSRLGHEPEDGRPFEIKIMRQRLGDDWETKNNDV